MTDAPTAYELAADDILSVLLNEPEAWLKCEEAGLKPAHMPTLNHRLAMQAVLDLRRQGCPVSDTTVMERAGGLDLLWITRLFALYDLTRNGPVYCENIRIAMKFGVNAGIQRLLNISLQQLQEGKKDTQVVVSQLIDLLSTMHTGGATLQETAKTIGDDFSAYMNSEPPPMVSTGLQWLDEITGGFERKMIWWVAAAYKQRKSTLMFMLALSALLQDKNAVILSREMPRRRVAASMISMLATAYLLRKQWYSLNTDNGIPLNAISAGALLRARASYKKWDKRKVEAVDFGIAQWKTFESRLRVYDTDDKGGALRDWYSVENIVKRDLSKYDGIDVLFADYLQLFDAPQNTVYEKTAYLATNFQRLAQRENLTAIVLAQKNEDSIKNGADSYSPGIKGGGDPAQTADYLIVTSYKQKDDDDTKLKIQMKLSRHGVGGGGVDEEYTIHPGSGLALLANWIGKLKL